MRAPFFATLCLGLLSACGRPPGEGQGPLELRFDPVEELASEWREVPLGRRAGEELAPGPSGPDRRLVLPGPFDVGRIDRVDLALEVAERLRPRVAFFREGVALAILQVPALEPGPARLSLEVPSGAAGTADELLLFFGPGTARVVVEEVSWFDLPQPAYVPPPQAGAVPVTWGRVTRRARGLFAGRPLRARVTLRGGEELRLALALPHGEGRAASVALELEGSASRRSLELPIEPDLPWSTSRVDLADLGSGPATVRFVLHAPGDAPQAAALAVEALTVPVEDPPTVLLITSDTHRGDHLGRAGLGVDVATPTLDALAARGLAFDDARSVTNITNPSHVTLLTGVHPRDHGIVDNRTALAERAATLAEAFHAAGWATAAAVSASHLGPERSGLGQGFALFAAPGVGEAEHFDAPAHVVAALAEVAGRPAFLWLHLFDAHAPYSPPGHLRDRYWDPARNPADPALPKPPLVPGWARGVRDLEHLAALYRAEVDHLDRRLEPVLAEPRLARAWIAFTADHGERLGIEDGVFDHLDLDLVNLHVPLILAGPGVPRGVRSDVAAENTDLGRTLLDLAGLHSAPFPGRNLLAAFEDPEQREAPRFALARSGQGVSVEREGWLLVRHLLDRERKGGRAAVEAGQEELFDLATDRDCQRDRIAEGSERAADLRRELEAFLAAARPRDWAVGRETSAAERAELRGMGYAGSESESESEEEE